MSVAFAGFSGVVAAFRRRNPGEWSGLERFRFMVEFSLATLALSLLPFFLAELGFDEAGMWRVLSLVLGTGALLYLLRSALRLAPLVAAGEPVSRRLAAVSVSVGIGVAGSAFSNAAGASSHPSGVYLAGVGGCLFVCSAMFAGLLLAGSSDAAE